MKKILSLILISFLIFFLFTNLSMSVSFSDYVDTLFQNEQNNSENSNENNFKCNQGSDLIAYVSPLDCSPKIVRDDLLEENDVPVYCKINLMQINPLIDILNIKGVSFSGNYSKLIKSVSYYPSYSALNKQPDLKNPGYIKIVLFKEANSSKIPEFVQGNLTAKISYSLKDEFGISDYSMYLKEISNDDLWDLSKGDYSFWNQKGYIRLEELDDNKAKLSIYDSNSKKIQSLSLSKGENSKTIYSNDFGCTGLKVKLSDIEVPEETAKLSINSNIASLKENSKFLDNKCSIQIIDKINNFIKIKCTEDSGTKEYTLFNSYKINLSINGEESKIKEIGDYLFTTTNKDIYLVGVSFVYLSNKNTNEPIIWIADIPKEISNSAERLNSNQISGFYSLINQLTSYLKNGNQKFNLDELFKTIGAISYERFFYKIGTGQEISFLRKGDLYSISNNVIKFNGFINPKDEELPDLLKENYEKSKENYESVIKDFAYEENLLNNKNTKTGEEALYNDIIMSFQFNQKETSNKLCEEFFSKYPNSIYISPLRDKYCNERKLSSLTNTAFVSINQKLYKISLESIYEPSFEEYGATFSIYEINNGLNRATFSLNKNGYYSHDNEKVSIRLISIDSDSKGNFVNIEVSYKISNSKSTRNSYKIYKNEQVKVGDYTIYLNNINLKKRALISLISSLESSSSNLNFSFKIGIEKRAVKLTPEQTKQVIKKNEEIISTLTTISNVLESIITPLKIGCYASTTTLLIKNLFLGSTSQGMARLLVMKGAEGNSGWYAKCEEEIKQNSFQSLDSCLSYHSKEIEKDVQDVSKTIETFNKEISEKEKENNFQKLNPVNPNSKILDKDKLKNDFFLNTKELESKGDQAQGLSEENKNHLSQILNNKEGLTQSINFEQARDLNLYLRILNNSEISETLKEITNSKLKTLLNEVGLTTTISQDVLELANLLNIDSSKINILTSSNYGNIPYSGLVYNQIKNKINSDTKLKLNLNDNSPILILGYQESNSNNLKFYLMILNQKNSNFDIQSVYSIKKDGQGISLSEEKLAIPLNVIKSYSLSNRYINPEIKYYSEEYNNLPAIVPFDTVNGWYVGIKPFVYNYQKSTSDSGRINIFYLCNVGEDGKEDFSSNNDLCQLIDLGVSGTYKSILGLSETDSSRLLNKAVQAINQAQQNTNLNKDNQVKILDNSFKIGSSVLDTSQFRCQDFMSSEDCMAIFNLCDPVICPSSRCDSGGKYKVENVVQSGVIGSVILCLPNAKEGILLPVCLSGVKAGIDTLNSVFNSTNDCLNKSLETGQTVGICDEIFSFYLCDTIWKQISPMIDAGFPSLIELLSNQGRGGGEYINIQKSWELTKTAADYFVNSYGINAKKAFLLRSSENIGGEICKLYTSFTTQDLSVAFQNLLKSDSPPQFTGKFDEIPLTSVTKIPTSQYKVYYHIYAGTDSGANYKVYLRNRESYYLDTSSALNIDSGYINVGGYISNTKDIIGNSGYNELCIAVNGQEICGFKETSTSVAVNILSDKYVENLANSSIKTEAQCASGTNQGIVRVCASKNPGEGTDGNYDNEKARWKQVGYCGNENLKCWLDTESVKNAIVSQSIEEETINSLESSYNNLLENEGMFNENQLKQKIEELKKNINLQNKSLINSQIKEIDEIIEKTVFSKYKANLLLLKANLYSYLLNIDYSNNPSFQNSSLNTLPSNDQNSKSDNKKSSSNSESSVSEENVEPIPLYTTLIEKSKEARTSFENYYLKNLKDSKLSSSLSSKEIIENLYKNSEKANINLYCYYGDSNEKKYTLNIENTQESVFVSSNPNGLFFSDSTNCLVSSNDLSLINNFQKHDSLEKYDLLYYISDERSYEVGIFLEWVDKNNQLAKIYGRNPSKSSVSNLKRIDIFEEFEINLKDDTHPIYMIWKPIPKESENFHFYLDSLKEELFKESGKKLNPTGESAITYSLISISSSNLDDLRKNLINTISSKLGNSVTESKNCWESVQKIYSIAGVNSNCVYSDSSGKIYNGVTKIATGGKTSPFQVNPSKCKYNNYQENEKLNLLQPGDIISYIYNEKIGHNAIFIEWIDKENRIAKLFDWNEIKNGIHYYRFYKLVTLKDDSHPVYMIWKPVKSLNT